MKNWSEIREFTTVYIVNEIEVFDDDDILIGNTKPFQKATTGRVDEECVEVVINGGQFDGYEFYFYIEKDNPSELLTNKEFKELKMTELKVWKDLKKFINMIDKLNEKSYDIMTVRELIYRNNEKLK